MQSWGHTYCVASVGDMTIVFLEGPRDVQYLVIFGSFERGKEEGKS